MKILQRRFSVLLVSFLCSVLAAGAAEKEAALRQQLEDLQKAFKFFRGELDQAKEQNQQLVRENERLRREIQSLEQKLARSTAALRESRHEGELRRLREEVAELKNELARRDEQIAELERSLRAAETARAAESARAAEVAGAGVGPEVRATEKKAELAAGGGAGIEAQISAASALAEQQDFESALRLYQQVLQQAPEQVEAVLGAAVCSYGLGKIDAAEEYCRRALAADPNNAQALGLLGVIAWRRGDAEAGLVLLDRAVQKDAEDAQLHNYRGIVLHALGRTEEAEKEFRKAAELDPLLAEAFFNLAVILAEKGAGALPEARSLYERSLTLGSPRDEALEHILYGEDKERMTVDQTGAAQQ